jgi:hypothetical protein
MATLKPRHSFQRSTLQLTRFLASRRATLATAHEGARPLASTLTALLTAAALADTFGLEVLLHADQLGGHVSPGAAQLIDTGLDHGKPLARIVGLIDLGVEVGDFTLHLFGHFVSLPLAPDYVR